jgi:hypothetical protein
MGHTCTSWLSAAKVHAPWGRFGLSGGPNDPVIGDEEGIRCHYEPEISGELLINPPRDHYWFGPGSGSRSWSATWRGQSTTGGQNVEQLVPVESSDQDDQAIAYLELGQV